MFEAIVLTVGYTVLIFIALALLLFLIVWCYYMYDFWVKKILSWENIETRKDIFYFMRHKEDIKKYINEKGDNKK